MEFGGILVIFLVLVIGAVLGWVTFFRVGELRGQVTRLEEDLARLKQQVDQPAPQALSTETPADVSTPLEAAPPAWARRNTSAEPEATEPPAPSGEPARWLSMLIDNWMIWLGGISVALAG
ncbi:MAG: DUF1049 domain-containing protein, partial [Gammaproteobacteria bacterium]|nr:DUF1049 domain-containing protein [Gammaproteobacteria bacterium]